MTIRFTLLAFAALLAAGCSSGSSGQGEQPDRAPAISAIPDQAVTANQPAQAIAFGVADEAPDALSVSATSTDQTVVSDSGLAITGGGTRRTLTVTPEADVTGDSLVTLVVTDARGLSASTSFLLSVEAEQKSMQQFARDAFAADADGEPALINTVEFAHDAGADDFADLFDR